MVLFAIAIASGNDERFYCTRSSCRVIIKSSIILRLGVLAGLINVSLRFPRRGEYLSLLLSLLSPSLSLSLPLFLFLIASPSFSLAFATRAARRENMKLEIKNSNLVASVTVNARHRGVRN